MCSEQESKPFTRVGAGTQQYSSTQPLEKLLMRTRLGRKIRDAWYGMRAYPHLLDLLGEMRRRDHVGPMLDSLVECAICRDYCDECLDEGV